VSDDPKQQLDKTKIIGLRVTEEELQNTIYPVMHDCYYQLGIIDHDTLTSFLRFCLQFWTGHYRMKKQQFEMSQQEIEEEKKKLAAIVAEKEAWEKWDNSTPRVIEKTVKQLEQMEKDLDRESAAAAFSQTDHQQQQPRQPKPKEQESSSPLASLSLEDMMA
jgi:flagellar biosynthesis GTPase FlhF